MSNADEYFPNNQSKHMLAVEQWLEDNVKIYHTPATVTLRAFDIDWSCLSGTFSLLLDQVEVPDRFRFSLDIAGRSTFHMPMFHSPLGAPASYCAIELSTQTIAAIQLGLDRTLPKMKPYGRNPVTGQIIDSSTPFAHRFVDEKAYESCSAIFTHEYEVKIGVV